MLGERDYSKFHNTGRFWEKSGHRIRENTKRRCKVATGAELNGHAHLGDGARDSGEDWFTPPGELGALVSVSYGGRWFL